MVPAIVKASASEDPHTQTMGYIELLFRSYFLTLTGGYLVDEDQL